MCRSGSAVKSQSSPAAELNGRIDSAADVNKNLNHGKEIKMQSPAEVIKVRSRLLSLRLAEAAEGIPVLTASG